MLLAIDVGNSETAVALFEGDLLLHHWRLTSSPRQTGDEISVLLHYVLSSVGRRETEITGIAVSSVVPALTTEYRAVGERLLKRPTFILDHTTVHVPILYHDPASVGADRLANALAVIDRHGSPAVVVDLGTATTFDVITQKGEYAGGVIAPGVATAANALFQRGARLAPVEIRRPERFMGRTTEEAMQVGIYYGAVGGVDALVRGIFREMDFAAKTPVLATGGLAALIAEASETITEVDPALTVNGIRLAWERAGRP
jgi:type III pantothenate kinase